MYNGYCAIVFSHGIFSYRVVVVLRGGVAHQRQRDALRQQVAQLLGGGQVVARHQADKRAHFFLTL